MILLNSDVNKIKKLCSFYGLKRREEKFEGIFVILMSFNGLSFQLNQFCFSRYKDNFNSLRNLKTTIEHCQHLLEKDKVQLMKDFEVWWVEQTNLAQVSKEEKKIKMYFIQVERSIEISESVSHILC